jgi:hypothetical protein
MIIRPFRNRFHIRTVLSVLALLPCDPSAALGANAITGTVRNQSRSQPAAGDDVILLDTGMQEEARAKTDALGAFGLPTRYPGKPHLVRVIHQGVTYEQQAFADEVLSISVFDTAPQVRGVTGSIEILRAGTSGKMLHVSDLYEIKNESVPPLTQAGESTFEVYLPVDARLDSVLAAGPSKTAVMISAAPVPGEPGHYAVSFPLRPGATKFAFNYDLPYHGHAVFRTKLAYPLQQFAVMIPPTMKFSSRSPAFQVLATGNRSYEVRAANQLNAGDGPGFEVSGTGAIPPLGGRAKTQAQLDPPVIPNPIVSAPARAALPTLAKVESRFRQTRPLSQSLVLVGVTSVLLATSGVLVWRARKARNFLPPREVVPGTGRSNQPSA